MASHLAASLSRMRDPVAEILTYNGSFHPRWVASKVVKLTASPFSFFRSTFHLFAADVRKGPFRAWPVAESSGRIVGDLHTENFGTFRAVTGDIVYDINDFDETTAGPYEYDLRRLATSLLLTGLENGMRLGDGVNATETAILSYLESVDRLGRFKRREEFEKEEAAESPELKTLLKNAEEKSRPEFMRRLAREDESGSFRFAFDDVAKYRPVKTKVREEANRRLPEFLKTCLAPKNAEPGKYTFQDVAERIAGAGSLGRERYAILLGKGKKKESFETLRLVEWKQSLKSAFDAIPPRTTRKRAAEVYLLTRSFQLFPKRYLGSGTLFDLPMQAREIGSNDDRFKGKQFQQMDRFEAAARTFGALTARAHLLGSADPRGPRALFHEVLGQERKFLHRVLGFAVAYTERVMEDFEEVCARAGEIRKAWKVRAA